jgi:hypothetical protein
MLASTLPLHPAFSTMRQGASPMQHPLAPSTVYRYRAAFCDLVGRARLAGTPQRDHLLGDAATIAALYERLTGTPLLADTAAHIRAVRAIPVCASGAELARSNRV